MGEQAMAMAKVHDQNDDQDFAEVDVILAQAKVELHRDRCRDRKLRRNMNLSDIPENFAHVPSCPFSQPNARPVSFDASEPDFASRDRSRRCISRENGVAARHKVGNPKLHILGMMAPIKWLRGYMGCIMAVQDVAHRRAGPEFPPSHQRAVGNCDS